MKILISIFFITSFIFLLSFLIGTFFVFRKSTPLKLKSAYSVFLAFCLIIYLVSIILILIGSIPSNQYKYLIYTIFLVAPFVIGKFSVYRHLHIFAGIQAIAILTGCIASFCTLIGYQ